MLLDDIRAFLIAQGAVPTGWVIYLGYIPDDQNETIALFETGGLPFDTLNRENERLTFQTRVRSGRLDYVNCHNVWKGIFDTLQDSSPTPDYYLVQCAHAGPSTFYDDRGRTNMTTGWKVLKIRS